jgi:hypothetical protein
MLQVSAPATFVTEQLRIACTQIILADSTALSLWKLKILQNYDENCLKDLEKKFDFTADYIVRHLQLGSNCENKLNTLQLLAIPVRCRDYKGARTTSHRFC